MKIIALSSALFALVLGSALNADPTAAALAVRIEKDGDSVDLKFEHDEPTPAAAIVWSSDDLIDWVPADTINDDGFREQTIFTPVEGDAGEVTIAVPLKGYDDLDFGPYPGQEGTFFKVELIDPDEGTGGGSVTHYTPSGPNVVYCLQDGRSLEGQDLDESETEPWPFPDIFPGAPIVCDYGKYFRIEAQARTFNFPANYGGPVNTEKVVQWITVDDHFGDDPAVKFIPNMIADTESGSIQGNDLTIRIAGGIVSASLDDPNGEDRLSVLTWLFAAVKKDVAEEMRQAQCGAQ
jgi:hypothetical protein